MSEVSRSAAPAVKPAAAPAHRAPAGKAAEERGDVFSALLSLVAETRAAPTGESRAGGSGAPSDETEAEEQNPAKDSSDNPVVQLLGWGEPRSVADRATTATATATAAAEGAPAMPKTATATATATAPAVDAATTGGASVDITGMHPLATPQAIDPAALPPGTAARATQPSAASVTNVTSAGMQPLATTEAIDPAAPPPGANTATANPHGAAAPALGDARNARTHLTRRDAKTTATAAAADTPGALRAPAAAWQPLAHASARSMAAGSSDALRTRGAAWANSTVSMDLSAARETDNPAGSAVSLTAKLSAMLAGPTQADGTAPTPLLGATTQDTGASPAQEPTPADLLAGTEAAPEPEPAQVSHWSTQHLRHAHLRLGEGGLDSVDIRLSMQGQDLSVDFRTDNADIRQSLAQQANQSLAALLERSGIALADVSVGAQQQQHQGQGGASQRDGASAQAGRGAARRTEADPSLAMRAQVAQSLRADGSRPLDLFV